MRIVLRGFVVKIWTAGGSGLSSAVGSLSINNATPPRERMSKQLVAIFMRETGGIFDKIMLIGAPIQPSHLCQ